MRMNLTIVANDVWDIAKILRKLQKEIEEKRILSHGSDTEFFNNSVDYKYNFTNCSHLYISDHDRTIINPYIFED